VDADVLREATGPAAVVDRFAGGVVTRQADAGWELGLRRLGGDAALGHVGRADDLFLLEVAVNGAATIQAAAAGMARGTLYRFPSRESLRLPRPQRPDYTADYLCCSVNLFRDSYGGAASDAAARKTIRLRLSPHSASASVPMPDTARRSTMGP